MEEELRFHEEMKAQALADADGMSGDEARAAARRRIGNSLRLREQSCEHVNRSDASVMAAEMP